MWRGEGCLFQKWARYVSKSLCWFVGTHGKRWLKCRWENETVNNVWNFYLTTQEGDGGSDSTRKLQHLKPSASNFTVNLSCSDTAALLRLKYMRDKVTSGGQTVFWNLNCSWGNDGAKVLVRLCLFHVSVRSWLCWATVCPRRKPSLSPPSPASPTKCLQVIWCHTQTFSR